MVTVIFVHGISVRSPEYQIAFQRIEQALKRRTSNISLAPCVWGDEFGARLFGGGASIPGYAQTKGIGDEQRAMEEHDRWELLAEDPLIELRFLALLPATSEPQFDPRGTKSPAQRLDAAIRNFRPTDQLTAALSRSGVPGDALGRARTQVSDDRSYDRAIKASGQDLGAFQIAWARAVVASIRADVIDNSAAESEIFDVRVLSDLATRLAGEVGNQPKGLINDWLNQALSTVGTRLLRSRRGRYSDALFPYIGDVLVYQGNGQAIRDVIHRCIQNVAETGPVILLGHSLGGIACVDLLVEKSSPSVALLITVGSQSPLFYEMDALHSLRFAQHLPPHFPRWLNIFDPSDFLSYVAKPVFKDERVTDVAVNNRQQFPRSHSSYWSNPDFWSAVVSRLGEVSQ